MILTHLFLATNTIFARKCLKVNSTYYTEFQQPIRARQQRYPLVYYILNSVIMIDVQHS